MTTPATWDYPESHQTTEMKQTRCTAERIRSCVDPGSQPPSRCLAIGHREKATHRARWSCSIMLAKPAQGKETKPAVRFGLVQPKNIPFQN